MHNTIKAQEKSLNSILNGDYIFSVPSYQRPYSWTEDNAAELFDDLFDAYQNKTSEDDSYFLGSLVLKKDSYKPNSDIIDGQQRLTTITILLAILRDQLVLPKEDQVESKKEDEKYKKYAEDINKRICLTDDVFNRSGEESTENKYILTIRKTEDQFFPVILRKKLKTEKQIRNTAKRGSLIIQIN